MIFPTSNIYQSLKTLGLNRSDTVMIHGDAGVAAQYKWNASEDQVREFLNIIINLLTFFNFDLIFLKNLNTI